ncbi:Protein CBG06652 [Caenorhabditis briggsae]|uniref:Protein CBG06652 n=1 Tax=Caenorhabditis briggsae TaxID=6238 RepID=A8X2S0_CAEBR|nr:Protein CBG06652 [Caenorhabditis briggsae]CAP26930.2 Protein CBG06652 [Caenorhabditis briggsae]
MSLTRFVMFQISLYLSQLYWGSVINMVFLLPFPAVYSIGPLKSVINCFYLTSIWFLLFGWSALMMFWILMVRLRSLARPDSIFFIGQKRYYTMLLVMLLYVILPIFCSWIPGYSSEEKTKIYVAKYYPNCNKALDLPGIFVNTSPAAILAVTIVSFGLLTTGGIFYITLCCIIIYEIRQQTSTWSSRKRKYHIKVLHDTVVQNAVKCVFLAVAPAVELWNIFLDPGTDTIRKHLKSLERICKNMYSVLTMVANVIFVAAPIPCTLLMFFQNRSYRKFFVETFGCYFCVSGASSMQDNSKKSGVAVFTIQQKNWL